MPKVNASSLLGFLVFFHAEGRLQAFPTTGIPSIEAGISARIEMSYYDEGLKHTDQYDPPKTSEISDRALKLNLNGAAAKKTIISGPTAFAVWVVIAKAEEVWLCK